MTVRHCSSDRFRLISVAWPVLAVVALIAIGLVGLSAAYAADAPEAVQVVKSEGVDAPQAATAENPPAPPGATETAAAAEPAESSAPAATSKEEESASPAPAESAAADEKPGEPDASAPSASEDSPAKEAPEAVPSAGGEEKPSTPSADNGAAQAEAAAPPASEAAVTESKPSPGSSPEGPKQETPPPSAAEEAPAAMAGQEGVKEDKEAAPLPPKPADADVLQSVLPPPADGPPAAEPAASQMVDQTPSGEAVTASPIAPQEETAKEEVPAKPELDLPPDVEDAMDKFMAEDDGPVTLRFTFRYQPWEQVIQWFADQCDLSLIMDDPPKGTFNYTDSRGYTPAEAIDLLNGVLLTKGYTLLRRDRMLMVINLEDGIPDNLVTTVPLEELDSRGEFELVGVLFQLEKFEPQEAADEIKNLIGPQGSVKVLPKTRSLHVTDTAGRLRTIRSVIQRVEDPKGLASGRLESYEFKNILPDEGLVVLRQLLDIPLDANATEDDTFRFAMDPMGTRLLFSGSADKIAKAREILEKIDESTGAATDSSTLETPQLEVYPIAVADPETVLKVMQTLLEGTPGTRLSVDPTTGSLVALCRPSDHATIRATIDQMQADVRRIEVIYLQRLDATVAAAAITKMFGEPTTDAKGQKKNTTAPEVVPDPGGRQLVVHGTENQIAQIRVLLGKMGETEFADGPVATGSRIRILQITGNAAETALENLRLIWPTISDNPIKEVTTPSAIMPTLRSRETIPSRVPARGNEPLAEPRQDWGRTPPQGGIPEFRRPPQESQPPASSVPPAAEAPEDRQTSHSTSGVFRFAAQTEETEKPEAAEKADSAEKSPSDQPAAVPEENASPTVSEPEQTPDAPRPKSPIVISRSPSGLMIASDDVAALDEFERLFNSMTGGSESDRTELTVFYLKYAKAAVVAETLTKIIGSGTTGSSSTASQDSVLGQLVAGSLGSTMGSLLNLGASTLSPTGMLRITPEPRLNALIVEANATDLRTIEEVLKLLDQPESPEEVLVTPRARLIPVYNMAADEVATIVKQVFADKMQSSSSRGGGGENRPQSPADFFAAMRGGREGSSRGGSGSSAAAKEEPERMTVGVDARSNSLIVFASESTYEEVKMLVEELDSIAGVADDEATEVVTLDKYDPQAMKTALMAILGENAVSSSSSSSSSRSSGTTRTGSTRTGSSSQPSGGMSDDMRRRIEYMRSMMGRGGSTGGPSRGGR